MKHLINKNILSFITAGKAIFTIKSLRTNNHFTFKVRAAKNNPNVLFVSVLTGNDNMSSYTFIGSLKRDLFGWTYTHSFKSRIKSDALSVVSFNWCFNFYNANLPAPNVEFYHEGMCCRCGRRLTTPSSITNGIGPECSKMKK